MPKKKIVPADKVQSERFEKAVQELMDAGELNPIEAEQRLLKVIKATPVKHS